MKRAAVGAEIEDKLALIGHHLRSGGSTDVPYIDSREPIGLNEVDAELAAYGLPAGERSNLKGVSIEMSRSPTGGCFA
jgi:hypothetical protein